MTKKEELKIALFQQDIVWEDPNANYAKIEQAFDEALAGKEVDVLVVPETFNTGFGDHMARQAEPPMGATYSFALSMAKRYDALFAGTWTVREEGTVYNRLHLVRPDGSFDYYDKAHTFRMSSEASQLGRGDRVVTTEWRGWRIRPVVCYDLRFPAWLRNTADWDYDLMMVCANWPGSRYEAWRTLLRARAIENLSYAVGCNRVGRDSTGIDYAGCSAIVDYKGLPISEIPPSLDAVNPDERIITATLSAQALDIFRQHWPFNLDFDGFILKDTNPSEGQPFKDGE
ncbi:MAG: nitrilase family protein [Bacteroidales bacterium]|nr:nitrilase family protein [Bacteroidales bacterium]